MASRRDRRIEPSFGEPSRAPDGFSVREEDRVGPSNRKSSAERSKAKGKSARSRRGRQSRGLVGIFGRLVYWCLVLAIWGGIAAAGNANLAAMAPGVSGALITTVTGLLVAIPAMFGYNFLVTSIRSIIVECDNFAAELASEIEHRYVEHHTPAGRRSS